MSIKTKQQARQERRLSENIRQAKGNRAGLRAEPGKKPPAASSKPPDKKGGRGPIAGFFAGLLARLFGRKDPPQTAQQSIPYHEMYRDGICRVNDRLYTKTD
ncbi:hypothetical protein FACS1894191_2090 [Clostridia bacterium]|nr:hypothetical protein FACS1894191_2090 [Clostridia bacterium]